MNGPDNTLPAPLASAPLPEVSNHTPWPSQYFQHVDPQGELFHVMVCRTTYSLRTLDAGAGAVPVPELLPPEEQAPLCESDEFRLGVNTSSLIQESDYAPYKPKCDVLVVNAHAYSPGGRPKDRWAVGFAFGNAIYKVLQVTGPRHQKKGMLGWSLTAPEPATQVPILYELACGGPNSIALQNVLERLEDAPGLSEADRDKVARALARMPAYDAVNPIGCGRNPAQVLEAVGMVRDVQHPSAPDWEQVEAALHLAPQIELPDKPFKGQDDYPALGLGPIGRWWQPRLKLAGTHDETWKATQWPKSPLDHDYRYWNCAPQDQQIDYPQGGEIIALANLTPDPPANGGGIRFALPRQDLQLLLRLQAGPLLFAPMHIDTVIIDPTAATLSVVRRATVSARTGVRALELGTWPPGTQAYYTPETAHGR
ncbi:DUF2169 family type VI secretion system accessory protein [Thauera butanivorans]|uniref:DUF2169 family type VI secretion system accessory protein n=1 Tax=Thauera butanivorans TaxID=86174 RepID=UPI003AB8CB88